MEHVRDGKIEAWRKRLIDEFLQQLHPFRQLRRFPIPARRVLLVSVSIKSTRAGPLHTALKHIPQTCASQPS